MENILLYEKMKHRIPRLSIYSQTLITFCTLKSRTSISVGQIEPDIEVEKINRGLMLKLNFGSVGSNVKIVSLYTCIAR